MLSAEVALVILALAVAFAVFTLYRMRTKRPGTLACAHGASNDVVSTNIGPPAQLIVATAEDQPLVTLTPVEVQPIEMAKTTPLDISSGAINRLSAAFQAAPSLLVANEAAGKRLMEVVVNGDLVRAADGNGLRAFARGAEGIKEHARLFEASKLQNMVNAAAVWQVASVVVAQKHLADISEKLDGIKKGIEGVSRFLDNQRKSRIEATYDYLGQALHAIKGGEMPASVRTELEACERDLAEIQRHLEKEYRQKAEERVEHKEWAGTGDLAKSISNKLDALNEVSNDLKLCLRTRIAAWHVFSLYPGEQQLKSARRKSIEDSIERLQAMAPEVIPAIDRDIGKVDSFWNRSSTLIERRGALRRERDAAQQKLADGAKQLITGVRQSEQLMLRHDRPTRMLFEYEGEKLIAAMLRS